MKNDIRNIEHGKLPPQAVEVEEAVIGQILSQKDALLDVIDIISEKTFYKDSNQKIYKAIIELNNKSEPIDILTVTQQLTKNEDLDIAGGVYRLSELTNRIGSNHNLEYHATIIREKELARDVIKLSGELITSAYDPSCDIFDITEYLITEAYNIGDIGKGNKERSNTEILRELKEKMETAKKQEGITGQKTGIIKLDLLTRGYQNSDLIIKAARPSVGKTAQALCEANNMANVENQKVLFFSLEMSEVQLMARLASLTSGIALNIILEGNLNDAQWKMYNEATSNLMSDNLKIVDIPGMSLNGIRKISKKHALKHGLDAIFIDYLQLITNPIKGGNREQEISSISRGLKILAKELNVPVIALAQLSRAVEQRGGDKKPILSDLRESGSLEMDADMVQFLYRAEYYGITEDEDGNPTDGKAYLMIAKHRNGELKDIPMRFVKHCTRFEDWDPSDRDFEPKPFQPNAGIEPYKNFHEPNVDDSDDAPF